MADRLRSRLSEGPSHPKSKRGRRLARLTHDSLLLALLSRDSLLLAATRCESLRLPTRGPTRDESVF